MTEAFGLIDIELLVERYKGLLLDELLALNVLSEAISELEVTKARKISRAYADGTIVGKNADERSRSETTFVSSDEEISVLVDKHKAAEIEAKRARIDREVAGHRIALTKAWLYSQGGIK